MNEIENKSITIEIESKKNKFNFTDFCVYRSAEDRDHNRDAIATGGTGESNQRGSEARTFRVEFANPETFSTDENYFIKYKKGNSGNEVLTTLYYKTKNKTNNKTQYKFSVTRSGIDEALKRLSNFSILGYGIDAIENEPRLPIVNFTYDDTSNSFEWNGEKIQVPDQIAFSETPSGNTTNDKFTNKITTAREFQGNLKAKAGLSMDDPETDLTFSGNARYTNEMFSKSKGNWALEIYLNRADISFLKLAQINYADSLTVEVEAAIEACGNDSQKIIDFYDTYGTHVLRSAHVGGQLNIKTSLKIDSKANKEISRQNINIDGSVKNENDEYINGNIKFDTRDQNTNKVYREISATQIVLIGGDVTTKDEKTWRTSLLNSKIPVRGSGKNIHGPGFVASQDGTGNTSLGLVMLEYTEIYKMLGLDKEQEKAFEKVFKSYMNGVNPYENTPQRLMPEMTNDHPIHIAGIEKAKSEGRALPNRQTFEMRGWMATYVTSAGLYGKPGSYVDVRCMSDAELGGWTQQRIYAGEVLNLREKTAYMSKYMYIEVEHYHGDNEAIVFTNNEMVSW